jgi:hypothetical protein
MNRCLLVIVLLGFSSGIVVSSDSAKPDGKQLLEQAQDKSNIFTFALF